MRDALGSLALAGFALGIAGRDILWELLLSPSYGEDFTSFAFLLCATIAGLAIVNLIVRGELVAFLRKLGNVRMLEKAAVFGILTGAMYGTGVFLTSHDRMGAGLFNVIDYGITPIATALVGLAVFKGSLPHRFWQLCAVYLMGLVLLLSGGDLSTGWWYATIAMALPFITASSDGLMKWLLSDEGGNLGRSELLILRFAPAAIVLAGFAYFVMGTGINIYLPGQTFTVTVLCGFVPLWLLCTALRDQEMAKLALWEFVIPALAFVGTLHARPENKGWLPLLGAAIILLSFTLSQKGVLSTVFKKIFGRSAGVASN